jgi:3-oxoadipyl-CoA thiolase
MSEAFLVDGVRTPIGRYGGALAAVRPDDLAAHVLRTLTDRLPSVDWSAVDDVVLGCANQAGEDNRNVARMALLLAGLPETVSGTTVNRLCGSGADAVAMAARAVRAGEADLVVAGGVESMSRAPFVMGKATSPYGRDVAMHDSTLGWRFVNPVMERLYGTDSMGQTAENVAQERGVSRADQDAFALRSQERTAKAQAAGRLAAEIAPVTVPARTGDGTVVDTDEHPRATTPEALGSLRAAFRDGGSVTAGNSSGVNDGAAALLVASERALERYGLTPLARVTGAATAGVAPRVMGLGPVPATRRLLDRTGLAISDVDVVELNEAFAAQALAVLRDLGLPDDAEHVNPNGGAIALGHPLGMSGARLALTAARELGHRDARRAVATMCIGVGQGIALLLEH